jgi:peptidoglycan/LPS O-acetylase OafA/YrhL
LAWLSFRFFETPFLNLKNRFVPKKIATGAMTPGTAAALPASPAHVV